MNPLLLILATSLPGHKVPAVKDLVGAWNAVQIIHSKPSTNSADDEKSKLAANSFVLLPSHKFDAQFTVPLHGKWAIKKDQVVLKIDPIKGGPNGTILYDPIFLTWDKGAKTLTREIDGDSYVFLQKVSAK